MLKSISGRPRDTIPSHFMSTSGPETRILPPGSLETVLRVKGNWGFLSSNHGIVGLWSIIAEICKLLLWESSIISIHLFVFVTVLIVPFVLLENISSIKLN